MRVAFLGLGIMGSAMAANLVKAGHQLRTWNRSPGRTVQGARSCASPAEAVQQAEVVWICVSDTAAVEAVLFAPDGAGAAVAPGTVIVDSSTISPAASIAFAARLRERGVEFIDAPVTGSKIGAQEGTLIFIAGGREEAISAVQPLFAAMGKQVVRVGENGLGLAAKLAMNLQIALIYEGFAEGLALARKLGVPQEKLFALVQASMLRSGVTDYKIPFVERGDFAPNFPLRLMLKDIRLMLEAGRENGLDLPALRATCESVYEPAVEQGLADLDYAATLKVLQ